MLFKPATGYSIVLLIFIVIGVSGFFMRPLSENATDIDVYGWFIASFFMIVLGLYLWYKLPVFTFAEDSVQITSHMFYLLGLDRKTVIRYADIVSLGPDMHRNYGWGVEPRHILMITMNGTTQEFGIFGFDDEMIAKIWLRFREKLGDRVTIP
jgi:hypothetical protein